MKHTTAARAAGSALAAILACALPALGQRTPGDQQQRAAVQPRVYLSGSAGYFTSIGGFVEPETDHFVTFDEPFVYGGALHVRVNRGIVIGVDAALADVDFQRRERGQVDIVDEGAGQVATALLSARLNTGAGTGFNLYLTGGGGVVAYELEPIAAAGAEPAAGEWDRDFALLLGAGLDYRLHPRFGVFGEYTQFWAYHQKGDDLARNTANHDVLRAGARIGL